MPEPPFKDDDGQLVAYVDILDTPCGKIAYQLAKYGYKFGISSRGTGDLITGPDGEEEVDPDTYQLNAFDLVEIPAVKSARLSFVESLDKKRYNKTLRQSLCESLDKENNENRKIMKEALADLGIVLNESAAQELDTFLKEWKEANLMVNLEDLIDEYYQETGIYLSKIMYNKNEYDNFVNWVKENYDVDIHGIEESLEEDYDNSYQKISDTIDLCVSKLSKDELFNFLQGVIDQCRSLANENGILVESEEPSEASSDKKEEEEVVDDKSEVELVAEFQEALIKIKKLEEDNLSLSEQLSVGNAKEIKLNEEMARYKKATIDLSDTIKELKPLKEEINELRESLNKKDKIISSNNSRINSLVESRKKASLEITSIKELNEDLLTENKILTKQLNDNESELDTVSKQLDSTKALVEKYRRSYKSLKENYLEAKAESFGLRKEDVLRELNESYKVSDIDSVCKKLSQYKDNIRKLPFRLTEDTRVSIKPSRNEYIKDDFSLDDSISDSLLQLANIK